MKTSFKTTTYGRVRFLEEALYGFLQQIENDSEMVIVNDYPLQTLIFDHPQVRIINLKETFKTIGEKENFAIEQCNGDIIITADDDDIALPNHLNNIKKFWKENTTILHWARGIYYNFPEITEITYVGNSGMVYSRDSWEKVGRCPIMNAGGDTVFMEKIHEQLGESNVVYAYPPDEEVSWIYRWGMPTDDNNTGIFHQSGQGDDKIGRPNIIQRHSAHIEKQRQKGLIPIGDIILKPRWAQDYKKLLIDYNKVKNENINNTPK